jgi:hypothetical protein
VRCKFHPRAKATAACTACGISLCRQCQIEDGGHIYCDNCYAAGEADHEHASAREHEDLESEDLIDLELMDMLDTDDDDGLF